MRGDPNGMISLSMISITITEFEIDVIAGISKWRQKVVLE